jgi:hypothetical protein
MISTDGERGESNSEAQANLANAGVPPSAPEPIAGETVEQVTQVPDSPKWSGAGSPNDLDGRGARRVKQRVG